MGRVDGVIEQQETIRHKTEIERIAPAALKESSAFLESLGCSDVGKVMRTIACQ
jgi:hypothetical protein